MDNKQSGEAQLTDVPARIEQLKWSRWHTKITAVLGAGWALDAYEINIVSAVLNLLKEQFKVTSQQATYIKTVWLVGALIGALGFGYVSDRYGRKKTFLMTIIMYSFFTIVTAFSVNYPMFLVFRGLTAIGVGAEYTAVNATIAEFIPAKYRGGVNTLVMSTWAVGALLANAIQIPLIKYLNPDLCWRIGMGSGAVAALCVFWFRRALPESPRWYLSQGRFEEASAVVSQIESLAGQPLKDPDSVEKMVTLAALSFGDYGVAGFMSLAILPLAKIPNENMPTFYLLGNVATVPAGLLNSWLMVKVDRKKLVPLNYILAIVTAACLLPAANVAESTGSIVSLQLTYCAYMFAYTMAWTTAYPALTEVFPTHLRSSGIGVAVAAGRVAGAVAPLLMVSIFEETGPLDPSTGKHANVGGAIGLLSGFFGLALLASIPWYFFGVEGRNMTLEGMMDNRKKQSVATEAGENMEKLTFDHDNEKVTKKI
ncbi:MFS general substrate transporter [Basidiobolus meristosporus CBS 931.73]|uniref:MFS general substrate transporter n=1 Tax=Basidiobolus meristosporus CBS 931.73 TaxID=1314790 RepID=A0A1Y1Z3F5_9FUNG|nr:MFS general substrate transporter [Basidiobolus meristosporus CBS 931.73]|eukprot:ORY04798.1 MFS general substrate transporter [Basidiobolus meristosporus CBS 931.73]